MAIWRSLENHLNCFVGDTLPETNSKFAPENRPVHPKKETTVVFQPSIFRCENVSFREATSSFMLAFSTIGMLMFLESYQTLNQMFPPRCDVLQNVCRKFPKIDQKRKGPTCFYDPPTRGPKQESSSQNKKTWLFITYHLVSGCSFFLGYQRNPTDYHPTNRHAFRHQEISEPSCETERVVISPSSEPSKTRIAWPSKVSQ